MLDWHWREDKPAWWRYFYLRALSPAELTGEPDALGGLTGGNVVGQVKRSVVRRFRFPPQEHTPNSRLAQLPIRFPPCAGCWASWTAVSPSPRPATSAVARFFKRHLS